jgi:signal transduction histidine kinase
MLPAFIGIHIPLFGIIGLLLFTAGTTINKMPVFLYTLGFTLAATAITLYILNAMIAPLKKAQRSLADYLHKQTVPNLPVEYDDEVGMLMRDINTVVISLDANLTEKGRVIKALSHDLRAPATNILALIRLIKEERDADELIRYVQNIEDSVNKQLKLMDAMVYTYEDKISLATNR